jgi:TonB-dependent starch-binding outer membrane protein SusC
MKKKFNYYDTIKLSGNWRKLLLTMKITAFLLFFGLMNLVAGPSYSQSTKISLNMKDVTVEQVLNKIENVSEYYFLFNQKLIDVSRKVDIVADNEPIKDILPEILGDDISFFVYDRQIILTPIGQTGTSPEIQQQKISGRVTDESGSPLPGVSVVVKGTSIGSNTDNAGKFSLLLPPDANTLIFSFIGMATQEIPIGNQTEYNVVLMEAALSLDEVVVTGYGTQIKKDISGSIAVVNEKKFNTGAVQSATDLIQGKVAGLSISTSSSDVTSQPTVLLRGISSLSGAVAPFYVIDGILGLDMSSIAPEDIESISVLKDASACAIYGSRAASGVILVTTKKGKAGQAVAEYSGKAMFGYASQRPPVLNASEYRAYAEKSGTDISGIDQGANTDWFKEVTTEGRFSQEHNLAISGGSEKTNYRASFNYLNNQGLVNGNFLERFNAHFTLNQKVINDKLELTFIGGSSKDNSRGVQYYGDVYSILPVYPVKNPDGTWWETYDISGGNPVHSFEENESLNQGHYQYLNMQANLQIVKGLYATLSLMTGRRRHTRAGVTAE